MVDAPTFTVHSLLSTGGTYSVLFQGNSMTITGGRVVWDGPGVARVPGPLDVVTVVEASGHLPRPATGYIHAWRCPGAFIVQGRLEVPGTVEHKSTNPKDLVLPVPVVLPDAG